MKLTLMDRQSMRTDLLSERTTNYAELSEMNIFFIFRIDILHFTLSSLIMQRQTSERKSLRYFRTLSDTFMKQSEVHFRVQFRLVAILKNQAYILIYYQKHLIIITIITNANGRRELCSLSQIMTDSLLRYSTLLRLQSLRSWEGSLRLLPHPDSQSILHRQLLHF